jgi:L-amino acid N-acyltransferase YncA
VGASRAALLTAIAEPAAIRLATEADLPAIVAIYNASIPGRLATADTTPVTVDGRREWFRSFSPESRPLWVAEATGRVAGWLSLRSFYGRPAYHRTVEAGVYVSPGFQRRGIAKALLHHAMAAAPALGIATILAFVFGHNGPSIALFRSAGFADWGTLPSVAELDGTERDLLILGKRL